MEVFYLKVNQPTSTTWHYLKMWLDIVRQFPSAKTYIICDNPDLEEFITNKLNSGGYDLTIISSARDSEELKYIIDNAIVESWKPAAYAHLTTFLHARDNGYKDFWNIDADDMALCAKPRKIVKLFKNVKEYAEEHNIKCFALDAAGRTLSQSHLWNFGIAYISNSANRISILKEYCTNEDQKAHFKKFGDVKNIDCFFSRAD